MNRLEKREDFAKACGVEIPKGGLLEMCQYVHMHTAGSIDGDLDTVAGYKGILRTAIETWEMPQTLYDLNVKDLCRAALDAKSNYPGAHPPLLPKNHGCENCGFWASYRSNTADGKETNRCMMCNVEWRREQKQKALIEMESRIAHAQRILEEFRIHQDNEDEMDKDMGGLEPDKTSYASGMIRRAISALNGSHRATASDGCGNSWETPCSQCGQEFEVIRPGKVQCGC